MNVETFLAHYQLTQNPFGAEEARHDPVFERLVDATANHPDFAKLLGRVDQPGTAVAFGEKGSGKTAIRLMIGRRIDEHNRDNAKRRVLLVACDDFNPFLDNLVRNRRRTPDEALADVRLADHQDNIHALAVSRLIDALLGGQRDEHEPVRLPENVHPRNLSRALSHQSRVDLAVLAALYDQPHTGSATNRFAKLRHRLGLRWRVPMGWRVKLALLLTVLALAVGASPWVVDLEPVSRVYALAGALGVLAVLAWLWWGVKWARLWSLARRVRREMPAVKRSASELRQMLGDLRTVHLARQPLPVDEAAGEARYQLTRRLLDVLAELDHVGITVLVDRLDEPTLVSGDAEKMKALIWPVFDNKFLQQERLGVKLLLPIELRHLLHRESAAFFQEARLDKQSLVDRLTWSGAILYDLCSARLRACRPEQADPISLLDLFDQYVTRDLVVDALDQMHQPRDAFKFLYSVIQEHCRMSPEDAGGFKIPRLTLESVRKAQSQRVQELYRGFGPA
ncbi:MAG: hypothetical protein WD009_09860 [Phycisphaeraceae bacterium]